MSRLSFEDEKKKNMLRYSLYAISFLIWSGLTYLNCYASLNAGKMVVEKDGVVFLTFFTLPALLIGAFYGYYIAMISFSITFLFTLIAAMDSAYRLAVFLAAMICFSLFSQYFFFMTKKKTIIAALVTLVVTSFFELLCLNIVVNSEYSLDKVIELGSYLLRDAANIIILSFLIHVFFSKAPDITKTMFPLAVGYTKAFQENHELKRSLRKTRVSMKITAIIVGTELLLGVSAAIFMVVLFPDLKNMMAGRVERIGQENEAVFKIWHDDEMPEVELPEVAVVTDQEDTELNNAVDVIKDLNYSFDAATLSYDIKMLLLLLCVGVPVAAISNFYTKMAIGAPLGQMSDFMYEFANADDDKKLEVGRKVDKLNYKSHDEIEVLQESMKTTVHAIEDYIGRIRKEQELQKELEVAQKASEAKSSFLSNMSHEIRTPINAVLGLNEMIIRESTDKQTLEYANSVKSAGNQLLGIINDILDFSKIEAGKMDILPTEYHLSSTINDLINLVAVKAEDKGLKLEMNISDSLPTVLVGDEIRIKQCVTNILTNAVKYTEEGTVTLNVSHRKLDDETIALRFQVIDTGIGIKEEDINKLYSPFERIEEIRNRSIEGTGLGMSIVKKILALMDTRLEIKSVYGEGSDFSFEVKQQVKDWEEIGDFKQRYKEFLDSQQKYQEKFRAPDAEILVVDDTPINLTVVKGLLKETRIRIDTAESGFETLDKIKQKKYDVIFIDHRMPEMDGVETLKAMKTLEGNLNLDTPWIALTANAGAGARDEYIDIGFSDYLAKPVNGDLLERMLAEYLPEEKLLAVGEDRDQGSEQEVDSEDEKETASVTDNDKIDGLLAQLQGVDINEAVKNCGSKELLVDVVKEFLISIDSKADSIESFADGKDYRNYTVFVHALKSSARLIGAMELSDRAAYLEQCGNEENEEEITALTGELLTLYRSYREKLSPINGDAPKEEDLPEISCEELESAFSDMKELLDAYDFDTADGIMKMLEDYRIPEDYKEKYSKVRELMSAVDRDALLEVL